MTKAELQVLIDNIDTTGNQGTTGQELKNIFEALKNELYDYTEVVVSSSDMASLDSIPKTILWPLLAPNQILTFKGFLKFTQGLSPYNEGNLTLYLNNYENGIKIDKTFITGADRVVYFSSENFISDKVLTDATTKPVLTPQYTEQGLSLFTTDYLGTGNGSIKAYVQYKIETLD